MKCEHANCRCQESKVQSKGRSYCSQACANDDRSGAPESACHCGHAGCS